jgi:hypothetical protein
MPAMTRMTIRVVRWRGLSAMPVSVPRTRSAAFPTMGIRGLLGGSMVGVGDGVAVGTAVGVGVGVGLGVAVEVAVAVGV